MRPPSARFLRDTVLIHPSTESIGHSGGPRRLDEAGVAHACAVQAVYGQGASRAERHATTLGEADYLVLFAADPGVDVEGQTLLWTHHRGGIPLDRPVRLKSLAPARPPGGISARWTVAAIAIQ